MNTAITMSFMQRLYESAYGNGIISATVRSKDDVLDIDTAFRFDHWELSEDKEHILIYGEDDIKIDVCPRNMVEARRENGLYIFNTKSLEMTVSFI